MVLRCGHGDDEMSFTGKYVVPHISFVSVKMDGVMHDIFDLVLRWYLMGYRWLNSSALDFTSYRSLLEKVIHTCSMNISGKVLSLQLTTLIRRLISSFAPFSLTTWTFLVRIGCMVASIFSSFYDKVDLSPLQWRAQEIFLGVFN